MTCDECGWGDGLHAPVCSIRTEPRPVEASHPHDGYAYDGCKCVCCTNVRVLYWRGEECWVLTPAAETGPEPGLDVEDVRLLTHAVTHLLAEHDCDRHGWETLQEANLRVRVALEPRP